MGTRDKMLTGKTGFICGQEVPIPLLPGMTLRDPRDIPRPKPQILKYMQGTRMVEDLSEKRAPHITKAHLKLLNLQRMGLKAPPESSTAVTVVDKKYGTGNPVTIEVVPGWVKNDRLVAGEKFVVGGNIMSGISLMGDVEHSIQLVPDYRVHHPTPYRFSILEVMKLERQLEELLWQGFIKPGNSHRGASVPFAREADKTFRLCIDYRSLNRYTVKNNYPMPRADELFDRLAGKCFFTKIDLRSGNHQIHVAAEDQPKIAFRSRFSHYEFMVMPFDLTNVPATFQTAMNDIFRDILKEYVLVYRDDILVYSRTLEDHLRHLRDVLQRLRKHDFYAKLSKCRFAQQSGLSRTPCV
ncbi:hypothetical protein CBR_g254 [Chara braunii]|uniref:Reverse transcriptase domain-containing protein n=1 Tax=Chara braunii TaxID=69332 RepID=A0A388JM87_CHABU|nr:hypothetical protein CBR_g254 [Chara braunii]|eukprot:GBG58855.1 hypothetical protein CBR_g254 [Chara braunii]